MQGVRLETVFIVHEQWVPRLLAILKDFDLDGVASP